MGTADPVNWTLTNRAGVLGTDTMSIQQFEQTIIGAGVFGTAAHSFILTQSGELQWNLLSADEDLTFRWKCSK
jgi:hypothetical protein